MEQAHQALLQRDEAQVSAEQPEQRDLPVAAAEHVLQGSYPGQSTVLVATRLEPELKPDLLSGICCPIGSVYNHHGTQTRVSRAMLAIAALLVVNGVVSNLRVNAVDREVRGELTPDGTITQDEAMHAFGELNSIMTTYVVVALLLYLLAVGLHRLVFARNAGPRLTNGPTLLGRVLFPLPTVYYHEGNTCNEKSCFSFLCGCLYTVFCYEPRYGKPAETFVLEGAQFAQAPTAQEAEREAEAALKVV